MRFSFKKISAIVTSTLMLGMTMGFATAANYPAPFVEGGAADVAIIYGTGTGVSILDSVEAGNIQTDLQTHMGGGGGTDPGVSGEAYALWTGSRKIYMNDSINTVKSTLTDTQLPTVLADGDFEGNVNADYTQQIKLHTYPRVVYGKHPTSDDDPIVAIQLGTSSSNHIYNASVTFDKAINLSHTDSIGESLTLFGQTFTIGAGSTKDNLYMYKSSETVGLSIGGSDPSSTTVTVDGATYTVELVSASDTSATIKVTDSTGESSSKEVTEDNSKKIQGLDVAVNLADEDTATNRLIAQITVGADKLKFVNAEEVYVGSDEDAIEGTKVFWSGTAGKGWGATTGFDIEVWAEDVDVDAIVEAGEFVDPVFGSFKVEFAGLNIAEDSAAREDITISTSSNDKATVKLTTHTGDEGTFNWYYYTSSTGHILADSGGDVINVIEMAEANRSEYMVVGNEENGYLLEVKTITNSSGTSNDKVIFKDVFSDKEYTTQTVTTEGSATVSIEGEDYTVSYYKTTDEGYVRVDYPDSTGADHIVLYPTFQTSLGANAFFYESQNITLTNWDGRVGNATTVRLRLPDGDGYTNVDLKYDHNATGTPAEYTWNISIAGTDQSTHINTTTTHIVDVAIGQLTYQFRGTGNNATGIELEATNGSGMNKPAFVFFEEQDDSTNKAYNAIIVTMEGSGTSSDGIGVGDVEATWGSDATWDNLQLDSDTDLYKDMDYWGVVVTRDDSDSDQSTATISYPDDQIYAQVYVAEDTASITAGSDAPSGSSTPLGEVLVKDTEVSSVATKNLIVIGGSCINTAAAALVGGPYCGQDWTDATNVASGEFMIKGYTGASITSKLALLVAGYNAADTVNAAKYLRTQTVDTSKHYKGTSSTNAELVVNGTA